MSYCDAKATAQAQKKGIAVVNTRRIRMTLSNVCVASARTWKNPAHAEIRFRVQSIPSSASVSSKEVLKKQATAWDEAQRVYERLAELSTPG
jgi:hypothetical protein